MKTTNIVPKFLNEEDRGYVLVSVLLGIILPFTGVGAFASFLPTLVTYLAFKDKTSPSSKEILRTFTNFTLSGLIIGLILSPTVFLLGLGFILEAILGLFILIYEIVVFLAILNNTEVKVPIIFDLIKASAGAPIYEDNNNNQQQ